MLRYMLYYMIIICFVISFWFWLEVDMTMYGEVMLYA